MKWIALIGLYLSSLALAQGPVTESAGYGRCGAGYKDCLRQCTDDSCKQMCYRKQNACETPCPTPPSSPEEMIGQSFETR